MTDPKYLSDEGSEATALERELLQAARGVRLSVSEKQAIWAGVTLLVVPAAASAAPSVAPAAATKAALGLTPLVKGVLLALGLGGLSAGGYWLSRGSEPAPAASAARSVVSASSASNASPVPAATTGVPVVADTAPAPSAASSGAPSKAASHEPSASEQKSALSDESAAVLQIRRTLRAGDASGALRLLEQARQRFPRGALSQEREALGIEALAKSGATAAAARKAQAFLRAYPKSPYASDVQSFAEQ